MHPPLLPVLCLALGGTPPPSLPLTHSKPGLLPPCRVRLLQPGSRAIPARIPAPRECAQEAMCWRLWQDSVHFNRLRAQGHAAVHGASLPGPCQPHWCPPCTAPGAPTSFLLATLTLSATVAARSGYTCTDDFDYQDISPHCLVGRGRGKEGLALVKRPRGQPRGDRSPAPA